MYTPTKKDNYILGMYAKYMINVMKNRHIKVRVKNKSLIYTYEAKQELYGDEFFFVNDGDYLDVCYGIKHGLVLSDVRAFTSTTPPFPDKYTVTRVESSYGHDLRLFSINPYTRGIYTFAYVGSGKRQPLTDLLIDTIHFKDISTSIGDIADYRSSSFLLEVK